MEAGARNEVLDCIDRDDSLGLLSVLVQKDSRTNTPGEGELARWLVKHMERLGLEARLQEAAPGRYNAVGILRGAERSPSLLFNGHLDTNLLGENWTVDPWGGEVDEQFIYGLGVSNMKAGCAGYLQAIKAIIDADVKLRGDVVLTFVVGELQGGFGTVSLLQDGLTADVFVNCEPTDLSALTLHAGAFNFVVELTGSTRHISKREESTDALEAACELVPQINNMALGGAATPEHELVCRAQVGVMHAGVSRDLHEDRPPQVADFCRLLGTGRYSPSQTSSGVLKDLTALVEGLGRSYPGIASRVFKQEVQTGHPEMPPFEVAEDSPIVRTVNRAYNDVRGGDQRTGVIRPYCFYGSDAAHISTRLGIPGVVCGPGGEFNTMPDERVAISDYLDSIRMYVLTILDVCGV